MKKRGKRNISLPYVLPYANLIIIIITLTTVFFSISAFSVNAQDWTEASKVAMKARIFGQVDIKSAESISYMIANISYIPAEDYRQTVSEIKTTPQAKVNENNAEFKWNNPEIGKHNYQIESIVEGKNIVPEIRSKIAFPYSSIPQEYFIYTRPSDLIDSDKPIIVTKASQLVQGEDDYYEAVFKLAEWVERNITYDLNSLTADVSQKSSWVLENRIGVCDELTNLLIAMCRSLGIPARFVSGVAYTDFNNLSDWGPHAWAEIYFPEYGWVPFDIAYNQFGFIDATHIKFKHSIDSNESSANFLWLGRETEIETSPTNYNISLVSYEGTTEDRIRINSRFVYPEVSFGSYNLLEVEIENMNYDYISTFIYLSEVRGTDLLSEYKKHIMLKPLEKKKVFWMIKVDEDLGHIYEYTFPFIASSSGNTSFVNEFKSSIGSPMHTYEEVKMLMTDKTEEEEKFYSSNIQLTCVHAINDETKTLPYYLGDDAKITCSIKNTGNQFITSLSICIENDCQYESLGITQEKTVFFKRNINQTINNFKIKASNQDVSKTASISITAKDYPQIELGEIAFPKKAKYKDQINLTAPLRKLSTTPMKNGILKMQHENFENTWEFIEINKNTEFAIKTNSNKLNEGKNAIKITLTYEDERGNKYAKEKSITIEMEKLTFWQKITKFFENMFG
ncbi:MAG: transglutaminase domain-containing protein [Nanoarchaeota archaeon]|nr:transglutaminase domain-containing protein [Nanoarchaeota archaeon]